MSRETWPTWSHTASRTWWMNMATRNPTGGVEQRVVQILTRMKLDGTLMFEALSAGMKRRVLLAQALVAPPTCCFGRADEPSRHRSDYLVGGVINAVGRHFDVRDARSDVPASRGHTHPRDRSRSALRLVLRLRHVPATQAGFSCCRRKAERARSTSGSPEEVWIRKGIGRDPTAHSQ